MISTLKVTLWPGFAVLLPCMDTTQGDAASALTVSTAASSRQRITDLSLWCFMFYPSTGNFVMSCAA